MARKEGAAGETLGEIESAADRIGDWVQENLVVVGGAVLGLLLLVGGASLLRSSGNAAEEEASKALAETRSAYLVAMGAGPNAIEVPELANPEAAAAIRGEYQEKFAEVASGHAGTVSGALAQLEVADLLIGGGDTDAALALLDQAVAEAPSNDRLRGMLLQRSAGALEDAERWGDAAARHEEAAGLSDYPLRHYALADAARCAHKAGDLDRARSLYAQLDSEAPDFRLPDHLRSLKRELQATAPAS